MHGAGLGDPANVQQTSTACAGYEWVILSGGPPTTPSSGACRTGSAVPAVEALQTTNVGLWLYASVPYNAPAAALMMKEVRCQKHCIPYLCSILGAKPVSGTYHFTPRSCGVTACNCLGKSGVCPGTPPLCLVTYAGTAPGLRPGRAVRREAGRLRVRGRGRRTWRRHGGRHDRRCDCLANPERCGRCGVTWASGCSMPLVKQFGRRLPRTAWRPARAR